MLARSCPRAPPVPQHPSPPRRPSVLELEDDHQDHKRVQAIGLQELDYRWIVKEKINKILAKDEPAAQVENPEEAKVEPKKAEEDDDYGVETLGWLGCRKSGG